MIKSECMSNLISYNDLPHYTIKDYQKWGENWEVIYGIPFALSRTSHRSHQRLSVKIITFLDRKIDHWEVIPAFDVSFGDDTVVQPDILVLPSSSEDLKEYKLPILIVEILSPSTAMKDRNLKFRLYESNGIKYYWLVEPDQKWVEVYELIDGKYARLEVSGAITFDLGECVFDFDFREIF